MDTAPPLPPSFHSRQILNLVSRQNFPLLHFMLLSQQVVPEFTARLAPQMGENIKMHISLGIFTKC